MARRLARHAAGRRLAWLALVAAVVTLHVGLTSRLADRIAESRALADMPPRMTVVYVRDMALAAPPVMAPAPAPPPMRRVARPRVAAPAASAPAPAASALEPPERVAEVPAPEPVAEAMPAAAPADAAASAVANEPVEPTVLAASAPASGAEPFEWPVSTRLSYKLTGYFRGDVNGEAQVEWVRAGTRYQVHLDIAAGPSFAPLFSRRMSSDGDLTSEGLAPRRYDQDTQVVFRDPQRLSMLFEPDAVVLANGERRERLAGVQDTASQFVQLSYLFTTRPELLRSGASVEIPLALPRRVERWTYDVLELDTVYTSFGELPAYHLKPRREVRSGGDLVAEIWFAPQLRYLPVRIRIRQDAETFIDLLISRRPEMAGP